MSYKIEDVTKLIRLLAEHEDRRLTIPEMCKRAGMSQESVRRWVYAMHAKKCVYVAGWRYVIKQWTREWAWGIDEIDAKQPPRLPEQTYRQRSNAKRRLKTVSFGRTAWAKSLPSWPLS